MALQSGRGGPHETSPQKTYSCLRMKSAINPARYRHIEFFRSNFFWLSKQIEVMEISS